MFGCDIAIVKQQQDLLIAIHKDLGPGSRKGTVHSLA